MNEMILVCANLSALAPRTQLRRSLRAHCTQSPVRQSCESTCRNV